MKKLFTLLALLTCFLGANAIEKVDVDLDFSTQESVFGWGHGWIPENAAAYFDLDDGCLHFHSDEATGNNYDIQLQPFPGVQDLDASYTITIVLKGTPVAEQSQIWLAFSGSDTPGWCDVPSDFQEFVFTDNVDNPSAPYFASSGSILLQCGHFVGDFWIKSIKISHDEREQAPVEWKNILENGDASAEWANPNMDAGDEANGTICAWSKEWGTLMNSTNANAMAPDNVIPVPHPALIEDGVFVCHAKAVEPPLAWAEAGEQWGQSHAAGDDMVDNTWQNQFWINYPRSLKDGEQVKLSFRYKASKAVTVSTQDHKNTPGDYLGGGKVGSLNFTTEWQTFEQEFAAAGDAHSLAFNVTGDGTNWQEDIDFYFDDLNLSVMALEEGFFVAGTDTEDGDPAYDFDNAIKFEDVGDGLLGATVGTKGDADSWVNQVMISTQRGNDKGFKAATIKVSGAVKNDPEDWKTYEEGAKATINLPVRGVWSILIDPVETLISFEKLDGESDKEPIEINPNKEELVINAVADVSNDWDNQFWVIANEVVPNGSETILEFDGWIESDEVEEAKVQTQWQRDPRDGSNAYIAHGATDEITFTTERKTYSYTIPIKDDGVQSIAFNMGITRNNIDYHITNVIWKLSDDTKSLINETGFVNFLKIEGAGDRQTFGGDEPAKKGDLNNDQKVNGTDIQKLINFIVDEEDYDVMFDVKEDGKINGTDIQEIINIIVNEEE